MLANARTALLCVLLSGVLATAALGCDRPGFDATPETTAMSADFSCICAYCFINDFCLDLDCARASPTDLTECREDIDPTTPSGCDERGPPRTLVRARRATRVASGAGSPLDPFRTESFFCVPDETALQLGVADGVCPAEAATRAAVESVNPCQDVPRCARRDDPAFDMCTDVPPATDPLCPSPDDQKYVHPRNDICLAPLRSDEDPVVTRSRLTDRAVDLCAHFHGQEIVPATEIRRYCFLSCITHADQPNCDEPIFDPPYVSDTGSLVLEIGAGSTGSFTVETETATVPVQGRAYLHAPDCGAGRHCRARISRVELRPTMSFDFLGETLSDVQLLNAQPIMDGITPLDAHRSQVALDAGGVLYVSGSVTNFGRRGSGLTTTSVLTGELDWTRRTFSMDVNIGSTTTEGLTMSLALRGTIPGLPPVADPGPDRTVECTSTEGGEVAFSASASTDPDGDLASFSWRVDDVSAGYGAERTFTLERGEHSVALVAHDALGLADVGTARVEVVDTQGPSFDEVALATDCLWPPDHSMHLFRLGVELTGEARDACDGTASTLRIIDVRSDQPEDALGDGSTAPDVIFGEAAFCLRGERQGRSNRPRAYTVVLEGTDESGNTSTHEIAIRVPHDQRPSDRCVTGGLAPAVADDDPRCRASLPEPTPPSGGCAIGSPARGVGWALTLTALALLGRRRRRGRCSRRVMRGTYAR